MCTVAAIRRFRRFLRPQMGLASNLFEAVHHLVATAAEVIVELSVLGIQGVILLSALLVDLVDPRFLRSHRSRGSRNVGVQIGSDSREHRRSVRAWLFDSPNAQRNSADIAEQLHKECVLRQSAGHHQLVDLNPGVPERLDDGTRPESCRLQQGPVLVLGVVVRV